MHDRALSDAAKVGALEIAALLQRSYRVHLRPAHLRRIAEKIDYAIVSADDKRLGVLRAVARVLDSAPATAKDARRRELRP